MIKKFKLFENLLSEDNNDFIKLKEIIEDSLVDTNVRITSNFSTDHEYDEPRNSFTTSVTFMIYFKNVSMRLGMGHAYTNSVLDYDDIIINVDGYQKLCNSLNSLLYRLKESKYLINQFNLSEQQSGSDVVVTISFVVRDEKLLFKDN